MPAAKRRTISPGVASPESTSSLTRFATCFASAARQWVPLSLYVDLSVTSSSTAGPNAGSSNLPAAERGWNESPKSDEKRWLITCSTSGRER